MHIRACRLTLKPPYISCLFFSLYVSSVVTFRFGDYVARLGNDIIINYANILLYNLFWRFNYYMKSNVPMLYPCGVKGTYSIWGAFLLRGTITT